MNQTEQRLARELRYSELYAQGLNSTEISQREGVSPSAVSQWLRKAGLLPKIKTNTRRKDRGIANIEVRPIPSLPGYTISKDGRVFNENYQPAREVSARFKPGRSARLRISVAVEGRLKYRFVDTLLLEAWVGPRPDGMICTAQDGNYGNLCLENLAWKEGRTRVTTQEFVAAWLESYSRQEVADRLGIVYGTVADMEHRLRSIGVNLPKHYSGRVNADADELNRMIRDHQAGEEPCD